MPDQHGFKFVELLVVITIILIALAIMLPWGMETERYERNALQLMSLRGIYQTMCTYSLSYDDKFPIAGRGDIEGKAIGFKGNELNGRMDVDISDKNIANNVTASLWILVRDANVRTKYFINPVTTNTPDNMEKPDGGVYSLKETWDFSDVSHLSCTTLNMYHQSRVSNWSRNARAGWVLMGDDNNATGPNVHTLTASDAPSADQLASLENSSNHGGTGQSFSFSDGSVQYFMDPFVGPNKDNVYARDIQNNADDKEIAAPPVLDNNSPFQQPQRDVMLLPLSGNNGQSISGQAPPDRPMK